MAATGNENKLDNIRIITIKKKSLREVCGEIKKTYNYSCIKWLELASQLLPDVDVYGSLVEWKYHIFDFDLTVIQKMVPDYVTLKDIFVFTKKLEMPGVEAVFLNSALIVKPEMSCKEFKWPLIRTALSQDENVHICRLPAKLFISWDKLFKDRVQFRAFAEKYVPQHTWTTGDISDGTSNTLFHLYMTLFRIFDDTCTVSNFTKALADVRAVGVLTQVTEDLKNMYGYAVEHHVPSEVPLAFSDVHFCGRHGKLKTLHLSPCHHVVCDQCASHFCPKCQEPIVFSEIIRYN